MHAKSTGAFTLCMLAFFLNSPWAGALSPSNFLYRLKVSFSNVPPGSVQTNFPALIRFDASEAKLYPFTTSTTGGDLRFTDETGTNEIAHEIERWAPFGTSVVWVRIPRLTNSICVYAYWGHASETNPPASTTNGSVWSEGFAGVWHLNESPAHTGAHADSTANRFDGMFLDPNGTSSSAELGIAGGANDFSGDGDQVEVPYQLTLNPTTLTVEAWARVDGGGGFRSPLTSRKDGAPPRGYILYAQPGGNWAFWVANAPWDVINGPAYTLGGFDYLAGTFDASIGEQAFFVNGREVGRQPGTYLVMNDFSFPLHIGTGGQTGGQFFFNGAVDEVRISTVPRSSNWVWSTWQNIASNDQFNTYGIPEALETNLPLVGTLPPTHIVP
ncbi:MAG: DUF2341 domain-containing protein, partial [Verrucomicrobiota bacterium]